MSYDPGKVVLACPIDGSRMTVIGSSAYPYKCQQGHQFDITNGGWSLGPGAINPPLVMTKADPFASQGDLPGGLED